MALRGNPWECVELAERRSRVNELDDMRPLHARMYTRILVLT
jgi:hypothetical protein